MTEELEAVVQLATTDEDKAPTRQLVLELLGRQADSYIAGQLAKGLARLDPTEADKRRALDTLLGSLVRTTGGAAAAQFWDAMIPLGPAPPDKRQACEALLGLLASPEARGISWLAGALGSDRRDFGGQAAGPRLAARAQPS